MRVDKPRRDPCSPASPLASTVCSARSSRSPYLCATQLVISDRPKATSSLPPRLPPPPASAATAAVHQLAKLLLAVHAGSRSAGLTTHPHPTHLGRTWCDGGHRRGARAARAVHLLGAPCWAPWLGTPACCHALPALHSLWLLVAHAHCQGCFRFGAFLSCCRRCCRTGACTAGGGRSGAEPG